MANNDLAQGLAAYLNEIAAQWVQRFLGTELSKDKHWEFAWALTNFGVERPSDIFDDLLTDDDFVTSDIFDDLLTDDDFVTMGFTVAERDIIKKAMPSEPNHSCKINKQ